jgi:hypothetical protein
LRTQRKNGLVTKRILGYETRHRILGNVTFDTLVKALTIHEPVGIMMEVSHATLWKEDGVGRAVANLHRRLGEMRKEIGAFV